jgi:pimeloyl-ACP methyl ester carboxylesterase
MNRLESKTIQHNGITTAYYDEGSGPVLLLLHGFTGSKLDFHDQIANFSDRYRVVVPDNRGHGESTNTDAESSYTLEVLLEDLESFVSVLNLGKIHLLGHSMGGMVALRYGIKHHQRLASLMLMDTSSAPLNMPPAMREAMQGIVEEKGLAGLVQMMRAAPKSQEVQSGIDFLGEDEHWCRIEEKLQQMDLVAYRALAAALGDAADLTDALAAISCLTTIIVGEADMPFVEPSRKMAEGIVDSRLCIIEGASHCPQYENADQWTAVLNTHLGIARPEL